ncbi:hypothetical protein DV735_g3922, partial [Chaetothyriales sp. CBS 134920]
MANTDAQLDAPTAAATDTTPTPTERLIALKAKATAEYAVKHYRDAAELYSKAVELQAEINGELAVENADLLYAYGKCLFHLAQQTSSVLGGDAAAAQLKASKEQPKTAAKKRKLNGTQGQTQANGDDGPTTRGSSSHVPTIVEEDEEKTAEKAGEETSQEEVEETNEPKEGNGDEEEQDDFTDAYEMLDIARISASSSSEQVRDIKTRIADIHDLQAEVSLEGERYAAAVEDLENCLALKQQLLPPESSLLAECQFKLSLALEFASQSQPPQQRDSNGNNNNPVVGGGEIVIDWNLRNRAIAAQQAAIDSCKLRATARADTEAAQKIEAARAGIADVQDMIAEMEQHLADLRKPPISVREETATKQEELAGSLLGSILGASDAEQAAILAKATAGASDISGLVKRKKDKTASTSDKTASTPASEGKSGVSNGKRKVDEIEDSKENGAKKVKIQES